MAVVKVALVLNVVGNVVGNVVVPVIKNVVTLTSVQKVVNMNGIVIHQVFVYVPNADANFTSRMIQNLNLILNPILILVFGINTKKMLMNY
jgi:hypothetical protein